MTTPIDRTADSWPRPDSRLVHGERHRSSRTGWLRAAVLGANDGLISTSSLVIGVAAADSTGGGVVIAAVAGMVTIALLVALGALAARFGGSSPLRGALRVAFWGALAMGVTALVGKLVGSPNP